MGEHNARGSRRLPRGPQDGVRNCTRRREAGPRLTQDLGLGGLGCPQGGGRVGVGCGEAGPRLAQDRRQHRCGVGAARAGDIRGGDDGYVDGAADQLGPAQDRGREHSRGAPAGVGERDTGAADGLRLVCGLGELDLRSSERLCLRQPEGRRPPRGTARGGAEDVQGGAQQRHHRPRGQLGLAQERDAEGFGREEGRVD